MFGNFLEETCTGTGVTLALAGATTDNIAFQEMLDSRWANQVGGRAIRLARIMRSGT